MSKAVVSGGIQELVVTQSEDVRSVLLVQDDDLIASTVRRVLARSGRFSLDDHVRTPDEALGALRRGDHGLVLLDVGLSAERDGLDLLAELRPSTVPVVVLTGHTDDETRRRALAAEPHALVYKPFTPTQLVASLELAVRCAERLAAARAAEEALHGIASELRRVGVEPPVPVARPRRAEVPEVSDREWEVLERLLAHRSTAEVARELFISPNTVRNHLESMYAKLGVSSRSALLSAVLERSESRCARQT
ncbi:MAG TPA: response regulator transcription factor [Sandaracinaceae bacterium LLY-WYZ-13_1]|nr:response regulator transcription factor [Sandaracinaceae bacterium LLY-WYZ-13_1]